MGLAYCVNEMCQNTAPDQQLWNSMIWIISEALAAIEGVEKKIDLAYAALPSRALEIRVERERAYA